MYLTVGPQSGGSQPGPPQCFFDIFNIDNAKSYATEANLDAALKRLHLDDLRHLTVRNRQGRWTAVFPASEITRVGSYLGLASQHGFKTIG